MTQFCAQPGCPVLVPRGRCRVHAVDHEHSRPNYVVRRWYRTRRWKRLRQLVLVDQAYACAQCGAVVLGLEVDHIVKHEGRPELFWNPENLQGLCPTCHSNKTKRGA